MTTFVGFNTINQFKKFTLTDFELIKRDLLNAFNIRQGQLPGRPGYGTVLWEYVFEPQTTQTQNSISISGDFEESNNINVFIYDLSGKQLFSYLNQNKNSLKSLNKNDLNECLYFAKIISGNFITTKKFVVR